MPSGYRVDIVIMTTPVMTHPILVLSVSVYTLGFLVFGLGVLQARRLRRISSRHVDQNS